jgi:hypothetical protein
MIERSSATELAASALNHGHCRAIIQQANIQPAHIQETRFA